MGEVAIARRDAGAGHQQAIEQAGGGCEADGSSLGHCIPFQKAPSARRDLGSNLRIPDTSNNAFVCIAAWRLSQCSNWPHAPLQAAKRAAGMTGGPFELM